MRSGGTAPFILNVGNVLRAQYHVSAGLLPGNESFFSTECKVSLALEHTWRPCSESNQESSCVHPIPYSQYPYYVLNKHINIHTSASACIVYIHIQRPTNAFIKYTKKWLLRLQAVRPS
jgi:hypothetical protein